MMLVYLFIIVLLFCIMYLFIYNDKELIFDNNIKVNIFEKFNDEYITEENGINYLNKLNSLNTIIKTNDETIKTIIDKVNTITENKDKNNELILNNLNNVFWQRYLENINQTNASVFNEYLKYSEPEKNKFYQQYL